MMNIITQAYASPCGTLLLGAFDGQLCLCDWRGGKDRTAVEQRVKQQLAAEFMEGTADVLSQAAAQLDEYFSGKLSAFTIPLRLVGTVFQQAVWHELQKIEYGHTKTYGEQAEAIGNPQAVRAVASANGANALQIFVPCHRIIGTGNKLTGYAGGIEAKKFLLDLEAEHLK